MTAAIWDRELVLVTGKGGVGKSSVASGLALAASRAGRRVLLAEVAADLHVSSALLGQFGQPDIRGQDPVQLAPNLHGVRLAPQLGHRAFLQAALKVKLLVDTAFRSAALTRFLLAAPTFPEIGILFQLVSLLRSRRFDHLIIDLPATGHALALATLPKVVHSVVPTGLIGEAVQEGLQCLTDPSRCWTIIPALPESMPVTETVELIEALGRHDISVGAALLNRMPTDPFSSEEREALDAHLQTRGGHALLGHRELIRLDRAYSAQAAFYDTVPSDIVRLEVPMFTGVAHPEVIERLAERFGESSS